MNQLAQIMKEIVETDVQLKHVRSHKVVPFDSLRTLRKRRSELVRQLQHSRKR